VHRPSVCILAETLEGLDVTKQRAAYIRGLKRRRMRKAVELSRQQFDQMVSELNSTITISSEEARRAIGLPVVEIKGPEIDCNTIAYLDENMQACHTYYPHCPDGCYGQKPGCMYTKE